MDQYETPILLLAFNKPRTTQIVFNKIREIKPKNLFISIDGPREDNPTDLKNINEVKDILKVDWPCKLRTHYGKKNLGCKEGIINAIDWFFDNVDAGIILEDDCVPNKSFFIFCKEMLEKYKDDERIMQIAGSNLQRGWKRDKYSYYFSKIPYIWGWATWRRAWKKYDPNTLIYPEILKKGYLKDIYPHFFERLPVKKGFDLVHFKKFKVWDHQWVFNVLANSGLVITPNENLIQNIGMESGATNMTSFDRERSLPTKELKFPLLHPPFMIHDVKADRRVLNWMLKQKIRNTLLRKTGLMALFSFKS
jgi:hypothetical protein